MANAELLGDSVLTPEERRILDLDKKEPFPLLLTGMLNSVLYEGLGALTGLVMEKGRDFFLKHHG